MNRHRITRGLIPPYLSQSRVRGRVSLHRWISVYASVTRFFSHSTLNGDGVGKALLRIVSMCRPCSRAHGVSFHQDKIMLWINASAISGECPRMVAHSSFGNSLVILPTSP